MVRPQGSPTASAIHRPSGPTSESPRLILGLLLGLVALRGLLWSLLVPPWQGPDEPKHLEYVLLLRLKGRPIGLEDASPPLQRSIIASMEAFEFWWHLRRPAPVPLPADFGQLWPSAPTLLMRQPLYYILSLPIAWLTSDQPLVSQLFLLRLVSVALNVLVIYCLFRALRALFPAEPALALAGAGLVAFLPQPTFIASTYNSDNLATLVGSALFWAAAVALRHGWRGSTVGALGLLTLTGLLTKRSLYPLLLASWLLLLVLGRWSRARLAVVLAGGGAALVLGAATAVALHRLGAGGRQPLTDWFLRSYLLDLDAASQQLSQLLRPTVFGPVLLEQADYWLVQQFKSFWASWGWVAHPLPDPWYGALAGLTAAGLASAVLALGWPGRSPLDPVQRRGVLMALGLLGANLGAAWLFYTTYSAAAFPQGRYLFPALGPFVLLLLVGIRRWSGPFRPALGAGVIVAGLLFDTACLVGSLLPSFYF